MYGHTSEKTWQTATDQVGRKLGKLSEFLVESEALYQELLELWNYHGNDDQAVADQLFEGTATTAQLQMVIDLKAAMIAAHDLYTGADWPAIRRMT